MSVHLTAPSRFDTELRDELHRRLLKRGYLVATLLGDVLSGKDRFSSLAAIGLDPRPSMHPEERLREALNQAERRRRLLDAGDERYGRCDICGVELPLGSLERMAWADRCEAHDARWLFDGSWVAQ